MTEINENTFDPINKSSVVAKCPITFTMHKIGGRWKALLINQLLIGPKRYGELKKSIPAITEKMLIQTLKELVIDGIVLRKSMPVVPPLVEYQLTECGMDLLPVLMAMTTWAKKHQV